jgi:hypothetical protein
MVDLICHVSIFTWKTDSPMTCALKKQMKNTLTKALDSEKIFGQCYLLPLAHTVRFADPLPQSP